MGLKEIYKDYFLVGAAVSHNSIKSHHKLIQEHFNVLTCENEMKWGVVVDNNGNYDYSKVDKIVAYSKDYNMKLRGHTIAWHNQIPRWLLEDCGKEQLLERTRKHISNIGKRYENDIFCWDLVNEAINDDDTTTMRKSGWTGILGENFMDDIFQIAHEILPNTQLFYNDYNESYENKSRKIYDKIKSMIERDIPIHGVGMQCHWNIYSPNMDEVKRAMEQYAQLGLRIHITEMDISMFRFDDHSRIDKPTSDMIERQSKLYGEAFKLFRNYKDIIDSVVLWGVADDCTWLDNFPAQNRKNWPLLFDENHKAKEAYYRIAQF